VVVDVLGLVLNVVITAANMADVKAAILLLEPVLLTFRGIEKVLADQG